MKKNVALSEAGKRGIIILYYLLNKQKVGILPVAKITKNLKDNKNVTG